MTNPTPSAEERARQIASTYQVDEKHGRELRQSAERQIRQAEQAARAEKDTAYHERNQVVAALAKLFPSGVKQTDIPGWNKEWHGCVYIDLPSGQVSWHFHDSQASLFAGLPPYQGEWDGHETPEKYKRLAALRPGALANQPSEPGEAA